MASELRGLVAKWRKPEDGAEPVWRRSTLNECADELEAALAAPVEGETELREQLARRMYECARTEPLWESASKSSRGFCYDYTDAIMPLLRPYLASAQQQAADAPRSQPKRRGSHSPNGGMCRFSQSNRSIR